MSSMWSLPCRKRIARIVPCMTSATLNCCGETCPRAEVRVDHLHSKAHPIMPFSLSLCLLCRLNPDILLHKTHLKRNLSFSLSPPSLWRAVTQLRPELQTELGYSVLRTELGDNMETTAVGLQKPRAAYVAETGFGLLYQLPINAAWKIQIVVW